MVTGNDHDTRAIFLKKYPKRCLEPQRIHVVIEEVSADGKE